MATEVWAKEVEGTGLSIINIVNPGAGADTPKANGGLPLCRCVFELTTRRQREVLRLANGGGSIVNLSSIAGIIGR